MPTGNPSTFVKSFFAESIQAAMTRARLELGTDALLINSREAPPEARHLGKYEVVFGACSEPHPQQVPSAPPTPPAVNQAGVETLLRRVEKIRESLVRATASSVSAGCDKSGAVAQGLIRAGVEPALAREVEEAICQRVARRSVRRIGPRPATGSGAQNLLAEVAAEISSRFEVDSKIGRVTALVGPPGCGKTTTLVKLAIKQGRALSRPVYLISTDTHRIGGAEQLRAFATIVGAAFQAVESANALAQAIEAAPATALVLIDTAGYGAAMLHDLGGEVAAFLGRRQDIDTHLVLTASMRIEDLYNTARLYGAFRPAKLLFTKADEASSLAAVLCVAARRNKPVSFLCAGQSIPEDMEPATKEKVVETLVRQLPTVLGAAA